MGNKKITICGTNVHPGETANLALPLPEQYSCAPLYMPIKVINGKKKGPCLFIFSGLKGSETGSSCLIPNFKTPEEAIQKYHYYSTNPDERKKIAEAGQKKTLELYNYNKIADIFIEEFSKALTK